MLCMGHVITGDVFKYQLYLGDEEKISKIEKIRNKIKNIKNFHGEYLILELIKPRYLHEQENEKIDFTRVSFFQICKCKKYLNLNLYYRLRFY